MKNGGNNFCFSSIELNNNNLSNFNFPIHKFDINHNDDDRIT